MYNSQHMHCVYFLQAMGFGEEVYYAIADEFGEYANTLAYGLAIFIFVLYMLDADQWSSMIGTVILDFSVLIVVAGFVLLVLLLAYQFPYGMVCLFALFNPLWLLTVKLVVYTGKSTRVFVSWLSGPLFTLSALIGLTWALWVFADPSHQWNEVARINAASYSQCEPNYELYPDCKTEGSNETCFYMETVNGRDNLIFPEGCSQSCTNVYDDCLNGFILWVGPVLVSMTMFFLSFFCTFFREGKWLLACLHYTSLVASHFVFLALRNRKRKGHPKLWKGADCGEVLVFYILLALASFPHHR